MNLLFKTWRRIIPLAIVTNKTLKRGDVVEIKGKKYYISCQPGDMNGKFYFCVDAHMSTNVTNTVR